MIEVLIDKCVGCGACLLACAYDAIKIEDKIAVINPDKCILCGACVSTCPFEAILLRKAKSEAIDKSEYNGVWVFAEQRDGVIAPVVFELLGKGRELADELSAELSAVLLGHQIESLSSELIAFGADQVIIVDDPALKHFRDEFYAKAFTELALKYKPSVTLAGATVIGRSFIPRVSINLHTGLTADCTGLSIDPDTGALLQIRPAIGGNIMATIKTKTYPQMATVRPNTFQPVHGEYSDSMIVIEEDHVSYPSGFLYNEFIEEDHNLDIAQAKIVCSGGRGLKNSQNFSLIEELSQCLNGCVGGSRVAVEQGWISFPHQVGLSGKTISPDFYIALGISGAIQHLAGMQTSRYIIAINRDPEAQIFQLADFGIVGDVLEILPQIIKVLKQRKKNEPI